MIKHNHEISHTTYEILSGNNKDKKIIKARSFVDYKKLLFSCDIGLLQLCLKKR